jgi:hypothetical protein
MRKDSVSVLSPFALLNPNHHSGRVTLYMMGFEADQLIDSKPCAIGGFQQDQVFKVVYCSEQPFYLFHTIDEGQFFDPGPWGDLKSGFIPFTDIPVKQDNAGEIIVAGSPGQLKVFEKITKVILDLIIC